MDEISEIRERNQRVELDKAWETSFTRRAIIAVVTYGVAVIWLFVIENEKPFLNGLIPLFGYIFSTLTLPFIKNIWIKNCTHD